MITAKEGRYFEGDRTGNWRHYYLDNGRLKFEGKFENGLPNGVHTFYYPNGQVKRRGKYLLGENDGLWEYFDEKGNRIISIGFENGKEVRYNGEKIRYGRRYERFLESEEAEQEEAGGS
ncbi:MAG: hypothetical protein U5L96_01675 [Owenweeksia sp.]|nr:hypothetical protein [Owenweeksia sp.]